MNRKIFLTAALLLILSACDKDVDTSRDVSANDVVTSNETNSENNAMNSAVEAVQTNDESLKKVIVEGLEQQKELTVDPANVRMDFPYYEGNYIFSTFLFTANNEEQMGVVVVKYTNEEYILDDIDAFSIEKGVPFSTIAFFGKIENEQKGYKVLLSYINDKEIKEIRTHYTDGTGKNIKLNPEYHTFLDVTVGRGVTEKAVEGRNKEGKVIYEQTY